MRERQGYPIDWSIEKARERGWHGSEDGPVANWWARVGRITLAGGPIATLDQRVRTPSKYDRRPAKRTAEIMTAARALVQLGHYSADLTPRESPDFEVVLPDQSVIGVECSDVGAESWYQAALHEIEIAVREGIDADGTIDISRTYIALSVDVALARARQRTPLAADTEPQKLLPIGEDRKKLIKEVLSFLRASEHQTPQTPAHLKEAEYPLLYRYGIALHTNDSEIETGYFQVLDGALAFDGSEAVGPALRGLAKKIDDARDFAWEKPLWLALEFTDRRPPLHRSLEELYALPGLAIAPYAGVILLYDASAVVKTPRESYRLFMGERIDRPFGLLGFS